MESNSQKGEKRICHESNAKEKNSNKKISHFHPQ